MLRLTVQRLARVATQGIKQQTTTPKVLVSCRRYESTEGVVAKEQGELKVRTGHLRRLIEMENDEIAAKFDNAEDDWDLRGVINDLASEDMIAAPEVVIAGLYACRRMNDHATAVRFLESVKDKCGPQEKVIWPWMLDQIRPTLDALGISTPEEMGYDKPELYLEDVDDM